MTVTFHLPGYLQPFAGHQHRVEVDVRGETVDAALRALAERYPGVCDRVLTEQGEIRRHVNLFLNEESLRFTGGLATAVPDGSRIVILPAVSGG
jgi:MoaD family protein